MKRTLGVSALVFGAGLVWGYKRKFKSFDVAAWEHLQSLADQWY